MEVPVYFYGRGDFSELWRTEAQQHKRNRDIESDVCARCLCFPWAGAEIGDAPEQLKHDMFTPSRSDRGLLVVAGPSLN